MAAPKRTKLEREEDLVRVAKLHREGYTQQEIAARLKVSQPQVCYDMKVLRQRWREEQMQDHGAVVGELVDYHRGVLQEAYAAWHQSKAFVKRTRQEGPDGGEETLEEVVARLPEGEYLKLVQASLKAIAEMRGALEPEGRAGKGGGDTTVNVGVGVINWGAMLPVAASGEEQEVEEALDPIEARIGTVGNNGKAGGEQGDGHIGEDSRRNGG